jgi:hypothetical protein
VADPAFDRLVQVGLEDGASEVQFTALPSLVHHLLLVSVPTCGSVSEEGGAASPVTDSGSPPPPAIAVHVVPSQISTTSAPS